MWHADTEGWGWRGRGRRSQEPARSQAFFHQCVDNTREGRQKHEIRGAVMADLDTEWYCLHLITPWPIQESVSLCGWALWVISRHAHKQKEENWRSKQKINSTHRAYEKKPFTCWLRTLWTFGSYNQFPVMCTRLGWSLTALRRFVVPVTSQSTRYLSGNICRVSVHNNMKLHADRRTSVFWKHSGGSAWIDLTNQIFCKLSNKIPVF